ncbi:hypothetical protein CDD83_2531 [Cordyceps sp. RAO-2017]|nr:hypothetical protein CDD83_2531 [Cordyceps sp. RAO-2017]
MKLALLAGLVGGRLAAGSSAFRCDLPAAVDPAGDGLPSADELYSSDEALTRQVERLRAAVEVKTVVYDDMGAFDADPRWLPFYKLHDVLRETYPAVHELARVETVNTFGLLYTINGTEPELAPVLLAAHQDVVPVADEALWAHPPFAGRFDGRWLWGRGAVDDKGALTAALSVLEELLGSGGWRPRRTVLVASGFDEEVSGPRGAAHIAEVLAARYGRAGDAPAMIYDEGGLGIVPLPGGDDDADGDGGGGGGTEVLYGLPGV